ncbi:MAG: ABC transporter permease [Calditrichaeota bacterium]|nr:MAG: ABC transporter permease [Calditrichota bacterium]
MIDRREINRSALLGGLLLGTIALAVVAAPWVAAYPPNAVTAPVASRFLPPSPEHWFGTDQFGRDVFARVLFGGRISLLIGLSVMLLSVTLGTLYGAVAGFLGGVVDHLFMRIVDALLSFPLVFLAVTCVALFGSGLHSLVLVLTFTGWMDVARLVRGEVHSLKHQPFILRARASGLPPRRIVFHHLIPNVLATVIAVAVIRMADVILIESALSFLGLGVQAPTASWGSIINDGRTVLSTAWWVSLFPGLAILATILGLHLLGEGLRFARQSA